MNLGESFSVLFITGCGGDARHGYCSHLQGQLRSNGVPSEVRSCRDPGQLSDALEYDVLLLCRVPYSELVGDMFELIEGLGKVAVFGTDDSALEPDAELMDTLPPEKARGCAQTLREQTATLARCSYAIVPTRFLAAWIREQGMTAFVNRVNLSTDILDISEEIYARRRRQKLDGPVTLGCFNGDRSRSYCLRQIAPVLEHVLARYPRLELHIGGHSALPLELAHFDHRIRLTPDVPWRERIHLIGGVDISLAPLDLGSFSCQGVSELKYLEAAAVAVPTIASRTKPFEHAITCGENGLLVDTMEEWIAALELLIEDAGHRVEMGERAREDVYRRYTPEVRGLELVAALERIWGDWTGQGVTESISEPERAVIHRLHRHIARQREQLKAKEHQLASLRRTAVLREEKPREETALPEEIAHREAVLRRALLCLRRGRRSPWVLLWATGKRLVKSLLHRHYTAQLHGRPTRPGRELVADRTCGQVFIASRPGLCAIEVLFGTYGRLNTPDVIFRLGDSLDSEADLVTLSVCAALLEDNQFHPFTFDPIPDSRDRSFYFELQSPEGVPGDAVSVWTYLDGGSEGCAHYEDGWVSEGQVAYIEKYSGDQDLGDTA